MADLFARLADRALGTAPLVEPRQRSRFEAAASSLPDLVAGAEPSSPDTAAVTLPNLSAENPSTGALVANGPAGGGSRAGTELPITELPAIKLPMTVASAAPAPGRTAGANDRSQRASAQEDTAEPGVALPEPVHELGPATGIMASLSDPQARSPEWSEGRRAAPDVLVPRPDPEASLPEQREQRRSTPAPAPTVFAPLVPRLPSPPSLRAPAPAETRDEVAAAGPVGFGQHGSPRPDAAGPGAPPAIEVMIGRIEVRTPAPPPAAPAVPPRPSRLMPLDAYLRGEGRR